MRWNKMVCYNKYRKLKKGGKIWIYSMKMSCQVIYVMDFMQELVLLQPLLC